MTSHTSSNVRGARYPARYTLADGETYAGDNRGGLIDGLGVYTFRSGYVCAPDFCARHVTTAARTVCAVACDSTRTGGLCSPLA